VHTTSAVYAETRRPKAGCTTFKWSMQAIISQGAAATVTACTVSGCDLAQHVQSCLTNTLDGATKALKVRADVASHVCTISRSLHMGLLPT